MQTDDISEARMLHNNRFLKSKQTVFQKLYFAQKLYLSKPSKNLRNIEF